MAVLGIGEYGNEFRVAGDDDKAAAGKLHDVELALAVLRRIFDDAFRRGGHLAVKRGLNVLPADDGELRLVGCRFRRSRGDGNGECRREDNCAFLHPRANLTE